MIATATELEALPDDTFLHAFEECRIAAAAWTHKAHVRMAWNYLQRSGFDDALDRIRTAIQRFNAFHQVPNQLERGYYETLTVAWLRVIAATIRFRGACADSLVFCGENPHLLARTLMRLYYTRGRIVSLEAKARFVEPDIAPLPCVTGEP